MSILIKCKHCGFECKGLTLHLKYKHEQTPAEYRLLFPQAEIFSKSVRKQMSDNNFTAKNPQTLENKFGKEKADIIKSKIGINSGNSRIGKKRPNQAETIKKTWGIKKAEWSAGIKAGVTNETRQKISASTKKTYRVKWVSFSPRKRDQTRKIC